jgi:hypothetical protein
MDLKSVLILGLYLACYYPTSYLALKYFGVRDGLKYRALIFGATIGSLQFVLPIALLFVSVELSYTYGGIVGLVLSYIYVNRVLKVKWYQNVATNILLPIVSGIVAAPLMLLLFSMGF